MIKGIQRNMIQVRLNGSRYFDSAYFVMRRNLSRNEKQDHDMLKEANRILSENEILRKKGKKDAHSLSHQRLWIFLGGCLSGGVLTAFLWFFLSSVL